MNTGKTYSTRPRDVESRWHVYDATDMVLGRLATEVSVLLQGKHKPIYARHILTGDYVVVVNAARVKVTGAKMSQKMYRSHSHYPGALRETPLSKVMDTHPDRVIREAVWGMLPKNTLGRRMLRRLRVYAGDEHPHGAQVKDMASAEEVVEAPVKREETPPEEAVADQVDTAEELAAAEAVAEQTEVEAAEEPVAEVEAEPEAAEVTEETVAETAEEAPAAEVSEEPIAEAAEEPVAEVEAEPEAAEVTEETVAEAAEEPEVAEAMDEPPAAEVTEEPVAEAAAEEPEVSAEPVDESESSEEKR